MCEPGRTRARPSRSVRTTTILKSAWSLAREARRSFCLRRGGSERRLPSGDPGRGGTSDRARWETKAPRSRSPAPRDDRSRSPAPRDDRSRSPARGDSPPRGRDYSRSRSRSPRRDDRRPPSRDRSPGHGGGGGRKTGVAGRWNPRGFGACGEPPNRPSRPLLSRARARDPSPGSDNSRSSSFSRYFHPPDSNTGSRARPPEKHARSSFRPSSPGSTVTSKRVATRRVDASSRTSSVRPHPHHT